MIQGISSTVIPNIAYFSQVAQASMYLTNLMNEAMILKSRLGTMPAPVMEPGTSKSVNMTA